MATPHTPETRSIYLAAPSMFRALRDVQIAIAAFRDGEPYIHPDHGELVLEEVKYLVVDPALEEAAPHLDWDGPRGDSDDAKFTIPSDPIYAAAPDLLAALEAAVYSEQLDKRHDMQARAAIAKAKGEA